jgi:DnaJ-class molecular chaperone
LYWKLSSAYETISDPTKRRSYDTIWARIKENRRAEEEAQKRKNEAAEKEQKRAAEEKAKNQKEESARQERLQHLQLLKSRHENDIFEGNRVVRRLAADLKRLQD